MDRMSVDRTRPERRTHAEELEAIAQEEARLGRPMSQRERTGFARGFYGREYAAEIRLLASSGCLDEEDGEEGCS